MVMTQSPRAHWERAQPEPVALSVPTFTTVTVTRTGRRPPSYDVTQTLAQTWHAPAATPAGAP